mmetsp:Transcript_75005/g.219579  ORF Transcript_75005/g.219579 Transcript_75005/m.219579 type:complete len:215 (-) Transcript_75005:210-854(-)
MRTMTATTMTTRTTTRACRRSPPACRRALALPRARRELAACLRCHRDGRRRGCPLCPPARRRSRAHLALDHPCLPARPRNLAVACRTWAASRRAAGPTRRLPLQRSCSRAATRSPRGRRCRKPCRRGHQCHQGLRRRRSTSCRPGPSRRHRRLRRRQQKSAPRCPRRCPSCPPRCARRNPRSWQVARFRSPRPPSRWRSASTSLRPRSRASPRR